MTAHERRIEIHDFQDAAEQLIRELRETGSEFVITVDGQPVAVVRPFSRADNEAEKARSDEEIWQRFERLRYEVGKAWPKGLSAADAVSEQTR